MFYIKFLYIAVFLASAFPALAEDELVVQPAPVVEKIDCDVAANKEKEPCLKLFGNSAVVPVVGALLGVGLFGALLSGGGKGGSATTSTN